MSISEFISNYGSKYPDGFTDDEINEMLKLFPMIDNLSFHKSLFGNTCSMYIDEITGDNITVNYHIDIVHALSYHLKGKNINVLLRKYKLFKIINK